jgi:hypothetical protein
MSGTESKRSKRRFKAKNNSCLEAPRLLRNAATITSVSKTTRTQALVIYCRRYLQSTKRHRFHCGLRKAVCSERAVREIHLPVESFIAAHTPALLMTAFLLGLAHEVPDLRGNGFAFRFS